MDHSSQHTTAQEFARYAGSDVAKWQALTGTIVRQFLIGTGVVRGVLGSQFVELRLQVSYNDGKSENRYPITEFAKGYFATVTFTPTVSTLLEQERERVKLQAIAAQAEAHRLAEVAIREAEQLAAQDAAEEERRKENAAIAVERIRTKDERHRSELATLAAQRQGELVQRRDSEAAAVTRKQEESAAEVARQQAAAMILAADPQYQQELRDRKAFANLKAKYQAEGHRDTSPTSPLYPILMRIEDNGPFISHDWEWLKRQRLNATLALYRSAAFDRTGNPAHLTAASSAWRNAGNPEKALALTDYLLTMPRATDRDFLSTILTTRGGALRDMEKLTEAEECAWDAIHCNDSYHPHNLLGAVYFQFGQAEKGLHHFSRAIDLGSKEQGWMEGALKKSGAEERRAVAEYLLRKDPVHYAWAKHYLPQASGQDTVSHQQPAD